VVVALSLAVIAALAPELLGVLVVEKLKLTFAHQHLCFAVIERERVLVYPAEVSLFAEVVQNAGYLAALTLCPQAILAPIVPDTVYALRNHAADSGSSADEVLVAVPLVLDSDPLNIVADMLVTVQALEQNCGSIDPNRFCVDPNHAPSDPPNVAGH
jgi:hypothetical protein